MAYKKKNVPAEQCYVMNVNFSSKEIILTWPDPYNLEQQKNARACP